MVKVIICYDSKYGNTKQVTQKIREGLCSIEGTEVDIVYVKEAGLKNLLHHDAIVLGAPNHMSQPSKAMKNFVDRLEKVEFKAKNAAVFGTYSGRLRVQDRAEKKLECILAEKLPKLKQVVPGLSVKVKGVTGPIEEGELHRCFEFGVKIKSQLKI